MKLTPGEALTVELHIDGDNLENLLVNQSTGLPPLYKDSCS